MEPQPLWDPWHHHILRTWQDVMRREAGGRCMEFEHRQEAVCNTIFISCGHRSTAKYLRNTSTQTCTKTYTHSPLLTNINLNKSNSETRSWSSLWKLWNQQFKVLPEHEKSGKHRFTRKSTSCFSLSEPPSCTNSMCPSKGGTENAIGVFLWASSLKSSSSLEPRV